MNLKTEIVLDFVSLSEMGYKLLLFSPCWGWGNLFSFIHSLEVVVASLSWILKAYGYSKHTGIFSFFLMLSCSHCLVYQSLKHTRTI